VDVQVHAAQGDPIVVRKRFVLRALTAFTPLVQDALSKHNKGNGDSVGTVILPEAPQEAYELVFAWFDDVIEAGELIPFKKFNKAAVYQCFSVLTITHALQIGYLTTELKPRYSLMLTVTRSSSEFQIDKKSIIEAYAHKVNCEALCCDIVGALVTADKFGVLRDTDRKMLEKLEKKIPELARDLEARSKA